MKLKRITALLTAATVAGTMMMTGCSSQKADGAAQKEERATQQTGETAKKSEEPAKGKEDIYTVKIVLAGNGTTEGLKKVSDQMSEISREACGVNVEVQRINLGTYLQSLNLNFASGEKMDLFCTESLSLPGLVNNNQILPLDDLLSEYGKETLEALRPDVWACTSVKGKIYGVTRNRNANATGLGFWGDKAIAEELGIDYENIHGFDELEEALEKVHEAYPDMYPLATNAGKLRIPVPSDGLGETLPSVAGLEDAFTDNTEVVNLFATDTYKEYVTTMYRWAQSGLIMPDGSTNTESDISLVKAGKAFGGFNTVKPNALEEREILIGRELFDVELVAPLAITTANASAWCIPSHSENPGKAMQVLNLLETDEAFANLFLNGVEGEHYVFTDKEKKIIDYPAGIDGGSTSYPSQAATGPNRRLSYTWGNAPIPDWDAIDRYDEDARLSPGRGFTWDNSDYLNEVSACANVMSKYSSALECGSLNPEEALPQFLGELEAAGVDKIIASKQEQLDQWLSQYQK